MFKYIDFSHSSFTNTINELKLEKQTGR